MKTIPTLKSSPDMEAWGDEDDNSSSNVEFDSEEKKSLKTFGT